MDKSTRRRSRQSREKGGEVPTMKESFSEEEDMSGAKITLSNWLRLARIYNLMFDKLRKKVQQECDCTLPQFDVLAQLARNAKPMSFVDLSRQLLVTSGNLTAIVDRLEAAGYVRRERNTKDRRVVWVQLTGRGRRLMEEMIPKHGTDVQEIMSVLSKSDQLELRRILGVLRDSLHSRP